MSVLNEIIVFLVAAVIAVPLSKRLGFGSVLGYLAAGMVIGPWGLGLITHVHDTLHFSELGVVLLLFIIGLELHPQRLWVLRKSLIGLGGLQAFATTLVFGVLAWLLGLNWQAALIIGICFSLSSTAFALQLLHEKKQFFTVHGRNAFAILLFQDLLVIPVLALLPLLGPENSGMQSNDLGDVARSMGIVLGVILTGHLLVRPLLRLVAAAEIPELFSAASLLVVIGTASLMQAAGLSMALGAFLAGVLLANSEFRHELEANIEPFKGLLLGLFFISVGMSVDLGLVFDRPVSIFSIVMGLLLIKIIILFAIAKLNNQTSPSAINLAIIISQGGEFGFVILNQATAVNVVDDTLGNLLIVVITISMAFTPILVALNERWQKTWWARKEPEQPFDNIEEDVDPKVIIVGFGRFGQIVARILSMKKIRFTALESSFEQVDFVRKFGNKIYFGDATRVELLRAARADKAKILVLSIVNLETSLKAAEVIKKNFPNLKIFARARNRQHVYKLMDIGVDYVIRETFLSSIELAGNVLTGLGIKKDEVDKIARAFREYDEALIKRQHAIHNNEEEVIAATKRAAIELQSLFEEDTGFVIAPPDTTPE